VEDNYPFYPIFLDYGLEIFKILSGKVIPETDRINFREGETGGGLYRWVFRKNIIETV